MSFRRITNWIPLTKIFPLSTFRLRLKKKNSYTIQLIKSTIGISGAKLIGLLSNGCHQVQLNNDSILGKKGTTLHVPKDNVILQSVKMIGYWAKDECEFLSRALQAAHSLMHSKVAFLDIGANVGLVTLGAMNLSKTLTDIHLFEPVPLHVSALKHNLKNFQTSGKFF
jgi:hypothetical protein